MTATAIFVPNGKQAYLTASGAPAVGYKIATFASGTSTPQATWADAAKVATNSNPVILDARGEAVIYWDGTYKVQLQDATGAPIWTVDPVQTTPIFDGNLIPTVDNSFTLGTAAFSWANLYLGAADAAAYNAASGNIGYTKQTPAEAAAGVAIVDATYPPGNALRYGFVPNNSGSAAANTVILVALVNASIANGPTGVISFPNTGGASPDTYYFGSGAPAQIRDGITLDLNGCILNFSGAFNAALNTFGFLTCIRDVTIQNGSIVVNYNGTGGVNNGSAIRIGSRSGYGFGTFTTGIFDQDNLVAGGLPLQGGVTLRNLRIKSNNPLAHIILATGGLRNVNVDNVWLDGQGVCTYNGFYYEYGWSSTNGAPGTMSSWTSSHMTASTFRRMVISNLATGGTSQGFGFNGAYGCTVEDINVLNADQGVGFGSGESLFYRTWALDGTTPRILNLKNIRVGGCTIGAVLGGAGPVGAGYLSAVIGALAIPARYQAQTDFLNYVLDGFSIGAPAGTAIIATGAQVSILNGACNGGGINLGAEAIHTTIENVQVAGASGIGIRFDSPAGIWAPARPVFTAIKNCKITASTGVGIALGNCQSAFIENNQIGANTLYDVAAETTQTNGVNIGPNSFGVRCRNNFTSTSGGAVAYQSTNNTVGNLNSIENEENLQTTGGGGAWDTDFQSPSAQVIAAAGTIISVSLKYIRLAPAGAVTGVIMQAAQKSGQQAILINESVAASTITFAASGTSRVAGGVTVVLAGLTKMILVWDSSTNLWY